MNGRNNAFSKKYLSLICILMCSLLCGCARQECSYCGQKRFCKEFDLLGVTRYICDDCLHDPAIAVSGNVAREYSALYENGTLEYPENSPLREQPLIMEPEEEPTGPSLEEIMNSPSAIPGSVGGNGDTPSDTAPSDTNEQSEPAAAPEQTQNDTAPADSGSGNDGNTEPAQGNDTSQDNDQPSAQENPSSGNEPAGSDSMVAEDLIRDLNRRFQADGYRVAQDNNDESAYRILSGDSDLHIRLTPKSVGSDGKYELTVSQLDGASSSDYVKCVIRSVLSYVNSEDYDGLGHDIYNNTIQNGSYSSNGVSFSYTAHTADEIERGSTNADFVIRP